MNRKPDTIRAIVLIFAVGLVITGFTSLKAPDDGFSSAADNADPNLSMLFSEAAPRSESRN